jgi:diguanylate cyclase (GGDEF)-like protein
MDSYPFIIAMATLIFLAVGLIIEFSIRRQELGWDLEKNRQKQQQLATFSAELNTLKKELARKNEIADQLPRITKKLTERLPPDAYPAIAVRYVMEFFHARKVGYFAPVEGSSDYTLVVGVGFPPDWLGKVRIHSDEGILAMALQKKMVVSMMDPHSSSGRRPSRPSLEDFMDVAPNFVAPVFGVSGTLGALVVAGCPFPLEEERIYVSMLTDLLSMALQNATHLDPSKDGKWVDQLTCVANRPYFQQRFESEIRRTENYRHALALFMFDIDEFKKINDMYGHQAGDVVIKKMAELVKKNTRSSDLVGRYGGDEFMVLITSTTEEKAVFFTDKLREKIATTDIAIPGTHVPVRITISGGIAIFPTHGQSTTELFRAADDALYESKRQGRNRILVATSVGLDGGIAKGRVQIWNLRQRRTSLLAPDRIPSTTPSGNPAGT